MIGAFLERSLQCLEGKTRGYQDGRGPRPTSRSFQGPGRRRGGPDTEPPYPEEQDRVHEDQRVHGHAVENGAYAGVCPVPAGAVVAASALVRHPTQMPGGEFREQGHPPLRSDEGAVWIHNWHGNQVFFSQYHLKDEFIDDYIDYIDFRRFDCFAAFPSIIYLFADRSPTLGADVDEIARRWRLPARRIRRIFKGP